MLFVLLACIPAGLLIYVVAVRPFVIPLTQRIPTGKCYRPTFTGSRRGGAGVASGGF
jgi:hypothetical protein